MMNQEEKRLSFTIDGKKVEALEGQSIMSACEAQGIYIPRLCDSEGLVPQGSCRVCSVKMNGRVVAACTQPIENGAIIAVSYTHLTLPTICSV